MTINKRERILIAIIAGICGLFAAGFGVRAVVLKPLREWDARSGVLRDKLAKVRAERRDYFAAEDRVKALVKRTFALTEDQVSAKSGERLTRLIVQSGLTESEFTRTPVAPRLLRTGLKTSEVGWNVNGEGKLASVINLLFLLHELPNISRIDGLSMSSADTPGRVRVRFRYLTLVIHPAPEAEPSDLAPKFTLESPERRIFDSIVSRDLLRPYFKAPPAPPPAGAATAAAAPGQPPAPAPPGPETLRVVSLSEWMGQPEVHIRDLANDKTLQYKPGDELAGGTIVMVDYRPIDLPGAFGLKSFSRVIVKIGSEYWAIERGKTLADKYRLTPEQMPEQLTKVGK